MLDGDPEIGHKVVKWMSTKGIAKKCSLCSGEAFAVGPICRPAGQAERRQRPDFCGLPGRLSYLCLIQSFLPPTSSTPSKKAAGLRRPLSRFQRFWNRSDITRFSMTRRSL